MCNCIEKIQDELTEKMIELNPDAEVVENVEFQNVSFCFGGGVDMFLLNPVWGKYKIGKKTRKFEVSMFPTYCPYCGEKLREEEEQS